MQSLTVKAVPSSSVPLRSSWIVVMFGTPASCSAATVATLSNFMFRSSMPSPPRVWQSHRSPAKGVAVSPTLYWFAFGPMLPPTPSLRDSESELRSTRVTSKSTAPVSATGITPLLPTLIGLGHEVGLMSRPGAPSGGSAIVMV